MFLYIEHCIVNERKTKHDTPAIVINFIRGSAPYTLYFPDVEEAQKHWDIIKQKLNEFNNQS